MTTIAMRNPSHPYRLTFAALALGVTMFAAGAASHAKIAPVAPASERTAPIARSVAAALPVEYYLTDDQGHANRVRALFETVNGTRHANGEPTLPTRRPARAAASRKGETAERLPTCSSDQGKNQRIEQNSLQGWNPLDSEELDRRSKSH